MDIPFPNGTQEVKEGQVLHNHICNKCEAPADISFEVRDNRLMGYCMTCDSQALVPGNADSYKGEA